jgi:hypothetical protein
MIIRDLMTQSFGVEYSTRCDEEGFGGIYLRDDTDIKTGKGKHVNHPGTGSDYLFLLNFFSSKEVHQFFSKKKNEAHQCLC